MLRGKMHFIMTLEIALKFNEKTLDITKNMILEIALKFNEKTIYKN